MGTLGWREAQCADDTADGYGDDWHEPSCTCPDPWCPDYARCGLCDGEVVILDDDPAFCPARRHDRDADQRLQGSSAMIARAVAAAKRLARLYVIATQTLLLMLLMLAALVVWIASLWAPLYLAATRSPWFLALCALVPLTTMALLAPFIETRKRLEP